MTRNAMWSSGTRGNGILGIQGARTPRGTPPPSPPPPPVMEHGVHTCASTKCHVQSTHSPVQSIFFIPKPLSLLIHTSTMVALTMQTSRTLAAVRAPVATLRTTYRAPMRVFATADAEDKPVEATTAMPSEVPPPATNQPIRASAAALPDYGGEFKAFDWRNTRGSGMTPDHVVAPVAPTIPACSIPPHSCLLLWWRGSRAGERPSGECLKGKSATCAAHVWYCCLL